MLSYLKLPFVRFDRETGEPSTGGGGLAQAGFAQILLAAAVWAAGLSAGTSGENDVFRDHGVAVPVAGRRGVYAVRTDDGVALAIATSLDQSPRAWILAADLDTGLVEQIYCPENVRPLPVFGSLMGSNGRFYTSRGGVFLEFDPATRTWTFQQQAAGAGSILTMAEAPDGTIWLGNHGGAGLHSFNPTTREFRDYGRMDSQETYLQSIGFDDGGWVYAGIGTARENLVAYHPATGERRQLAWEARRTTGVGSVWRGAELPGQQSRLADDITAIIKGDDPDDLLALLDGKPEPPQAGVLYGTVHGVTYRLSDGYADPVTQRPAGLPQPKGLAQLPDGRIVREFDFATRRLVVESPDGGRQTFDFDYETSGAPIRYQALAAGADGKIYVNSGGAPYFACYDPQTDTLSHFPDTHAQQSLTTQGRFIIGGRYTGGKLKVFDTTRPWNKNPAPGEGRPNPFRAIPSSRPHINRPIVTFAHPDGAHVMIAGMPGYGRAGGGLSIYNLETEAILKLSHEELILHHSITALAALPGGDLVGSTTVSGTHGGRAVERNAVLFRFNWETKAVVWRTAPIPGAGHITLHRAEPDGRLYCTGGGLFFVYDLQAGRIIHQDGEIPLTDLQILDLPDGRTLMLTGQEISEFDLNTYQRKLITRSPFWSVRAVVSGDRMYAFQGTRLWSYRY